MRQPQIVLISGAAEDGETWADVLPILDDPALVHELPGHGDRDGAPLATVEAMTADLLTSLDSPAVLVGHSLGGAVALTAALAAPERVAGLVLVGTGAALRVSPLFLDPLPERFDDVVAMVVAASTRDDALAARHAAMMHRHDGTVLHADFAACDGYDVTARLEELDMPVTVLAGTADKMTPPRLAKTLAKGLRAELVVLDGVGHLIAWEAPEVVAAAITEVRGAAG